MKYDYIKEFTLHYSEIDSSAHFSLVSCLNYIQNMSTEYFATMKTDNFTLSTQNNAVWVITKTKVKFIKIPVWKDEIKVRIYSVKISAIRYNVEISFENADGEIAVIAKQEYCAMDIQTRKARKISTVSFPNDLECEKEKYPEDYRRLREELTLEEFVYSQKIASQDIDFSKHTNNVVYVRYLLNIFSCNFLEKNPIQDFEIHYISESKEGQDLEIYRRNISEKEVEFLVKSGEKDITRAYITFQ
ncbi:MAG: hypothetical protein IJ629_03565 [Clostridia bacterium]|nr:hypothetical protein [Clostridia bacterium]